MWNPMEAMNMGHGSDSLIAHITPKEAMILKALGGKGTVNPHTGFLQFTDDSGMGGMGDMGGGPGEGEAAAAAAEAAAAESSAVGGEMGGGFGSPDDVSESGFAQEMGPPGMMNYTDMDIGPQNMGFVEGLGAKGRGFVESFMANPVAAMTPSYATLASVLGMLSPMPMGMMFGYNVGKMADQYGFSNNVGETAPGGPNDETFGETTATAPASEPAGLVPTPSLTSSIAPSASTQNYLQDQTWRSLANRGTGGGGLSRLLRG